ncbi:MAG: hypothetical protein P1P86_09445 [Bacteroidales bacterium]|nr:hypothetical protein [Bacteroidales bacterium]
MSDTKRQKPELPEAFSIWNMEIRGKAAWVLTGYDDRGLMYSLLDAAECLQWSNDIKAPFNELEDTFEQADVSTRAVSLYTMNRAYWESRFYDEAYWAGYMDMLAKNR